ncbi:MAG: hypothetical protein K2Q24_04520 [Chitinophagaceae bacterium]|nr:hypothetical protein [Chitinophagaceae bacterium]
MQKIFTLALLLLITSTSEAQFKKGNKVLGFGLSFYNQTNSGSIYSPLNAYTNQNLSTSLTLSIAKAKSETRLNGFFINSGYGNSKYDNNSNINDRYDESFSVNGGYFIRKYKSIVNKFYVFGEGAANVGYARQNIYYNPSSSIRQTNVYTGISVYPGIAYKWNDRFLFEVRFSDFANINFQYGESVNNPGDKNINRSVSFGTSLGLGYFNNIGIGARWIIK